MKELRQYIRHILLEKANFKLKGSPRNTAGWNSVEAAGHIVEKIGPILATKYSEVK